MLMSGVLTMGAQNINVNDIKGFVNHELVVKVMADADISNYIAAGFFVELPEGYSLSGAGVEINEEVKSDHVARIGRVNDNKYRVAVYSLNNSPFDLSGNGTSPMTLCTLKLQAPDRVCNIIGKLLSLEFATGGHALVTKSPVSFDIIVQGPGDVNVSGSVDVQDATIAVNHILGTENSEEYDFTLLDMNNDGKVNVFDVTAIINVILTNGGNPVAAARGLARQDEALESVRLTADKSGLLLGIDNASRYTSFQFDVEVPEGADLMDVEFNGETDHVLQFAKNGEHRYTVVALSMSSKPLPVSDGALVNLRLSGNADGEVNIGNILFVTPEGRAARFNGASMHMATGIVSATLNEKGQMTNDEWYDLNGRKISGQPMRKGVYINNKKKKVVK